ncbi:hypothetical protein J3F84DRAFT_372906 [Trichoderma pleuroticola]
MPLQQRLYVRVLLFYQVICNIIPLAGHHFAISFTGREANQRRCGFAWQAPVYSPLAFAFISLRIPTETCRVGLGWPRTITSPNLTVFHAVRNTRSRDAPCLMQGAANKALRG